MNNLVELDQNAIRGPQKRRNQNIQQYMLYIISSFSVPFHFISFQLSQPVVYLKYVKLHYIVCLSNSNFQLWDFNLHLAHNNPVRLKKSCYNINKQVLINSLHDRKCWLHLMVQQYGVSRKKLISNIKHLQKSFSSQINSA